MRLKIECTRAVWLATSSLLLGACGDDAAPTAAAPEQAAAPTAVAATAKASGETAVDDEKRTPEIPDEMFAESPQNRDPFRSYIDEVSRPTGEVESDVSVLMEDYSLDELNLIATIAGGTAPRAMFRDPGGRGVVVQRGDHISRAHARVIRILSSKVIVEIRKTLPGQKTQVSVREVDMNPEVILQ